MTKTATGLWAMTLVRAYGVYNKGETAGFLPETAEKLQAAGVARPYDPNAKVELAPADDGVIADLAARAAELDAREAELAAREAALSAAATSAPAAKPDDAAGAPPKQGK